MLRATAALGSWMFRIVRNECLRRARMFSQFTTRQPHPDAGPDTGLDAISGPVEDDVLARLEAEAVVAVIVALPADLRRVLVLRDVQGLSGRAVAQELGLSVAAMKSRLHRARAAVRTALLNQENQEADLG
jgi:RNA polymerase sigma factor (sigma-70 family)